MYINEDEDWDKAVKRKEYDRNYYQRNREKILRRHRERTLENRAVAKRYQQRLKIKVLSHYSKGTIPECVLCGEERMGCLSIDHIKGDGARQRRELGFSSGGKFYRWLIKNNYPRGYQTLCMNDQWLKGGNNIGRNRTSIKNK